MGKIAAFFREQNIPLAVQQKQKVLSLDAQFQQMETERDALKVENLHLKAQVNPLEREVERLKDQIQEMKDKAAAHVEDALDEIAEALLVAIANTATNHGNTSCRCYWRTSARFLLHWIVDKNEVHNTDHGHAIGLRNETEGS